MADIITFKYLEEKNQKNFLCGEKYFLKRITSNDLFYYFSKIIFKIKDVNEDGLHLCGFFKRGENLSSENYSFILEIFPLYGEIDKKSLKIRRGKTSLLEDKIQICEIPKNDKKGNNLFEEWTDKINIYLKNPFENK